MELIEYISKDDIALTLHETIEEALTVFKELCYSHLPVLENGMYVGCIAKEDLIFEVDKNKTIKEFKYLFHFDFVIENDNFLDVVVKFSNTHTNLLPVVGDDNVYAGYIDLADVLTHFTKSPFLSNEGVVLILEKDTTEFTMSETCQIVETNGNNLLGVYITKQTPQKTEITIRVTATKINELIQLFRMYKYTIMNQRIEDSYLDDLKKRSEYFFKFLNI